MDCSITLITTWIVAFSKEISPRKYRFFKLKLQISPINSNIKEREFRRTKTLQVKKHMQLILLI